MVVRETIQKIGRILSVKIIRQPSLSKIQELYDMEPIQAD